MTTKGREMVERMHRIFVDGYLSGEQGQTNSPREIGAMYPTLSSVEIECYLNGQDDGRRADLWRVENMGLVNLLAERRATR